MPRIKALGRVFAILTLCSLFSAAQNKPLLTLDDFFDSVSIDSVRLSPNGGSVVIATSRADWDKNRFREDLWLYRENASGLVQLTRSGQDHDPQWSPDGKWIAFLSERSAALTKGENVANRERSPEIARLYLVSPTDGATYAVEEGDEEVHSFAWSADSSALYFATREPWSNAQEENYRNQWKDAERYRESERGDVIYSIAVTQIIAHAREGISSANKIGSSPFRIEQLAASPDGSNLAFLTTAVSQRWEDLDAYEIYLLHLGSAIARDPERLTRNNAVEENLQWSPDSLGLFFVVRSGSVDGAYQDVQGRIYSLDPKTKSIQRWAKSFAGTIEEYALTKDGGLLATAALGTEVQFYFQSSPNSDFAEISGLQGSYGKVTGDDPGHHISAVPGSAHVAFQYSSGEHPAEVYFASSKEDIRQAQAITSFNRRLAEHELPKLTTYHWTADDGTPVEGLLLYPPGKFGAKHLRTFTLIHGGPVPYGLRNGFEADWYEWGALAASNDWLVFEPNYRGSAAYGDRFMLGIIPKLVSRPGKDILEGIDALVRDGIADPDQLTVGGYSYGGYLTNWLITQTDRFRAAVTGAGAVEHAAEWGIDDTTFDDAYFMGGRPWEAAQNYMDEAAIFHFGNVKTPTHIVTGGSDIRVAAAQAYLLDHALHSLGVPETLLIFPGEGHGLGHNPWHGKIKVREELKWLEKYGQPSAPAGVTSGDAR